MPRKVKRIWGCPDSIDEAFYFGDIDLELVSIRIVSIPIISEPAEFPVSLVLVVSETASSFVDEPHATATNTIVIKNNFLISLDHN